MRKHAADNLVLLWGQDINCQMICPCSALTNRKEMGLAEIAGFGA
ncbi:4808_t:CDS:2 [Cetraspora pellucida]|uniref:4808_t:CDS:1 n=1 Tax=Cetraspora pellucida TaxID=1433469 RepID=A0ACA9KFN1_9GLOM|nr:4808_t:CDS:2 [Cetraspora pellucida]